MTAWVGSEVGQTWHTLTSSPRLPGVQKRLARRLDPAFVAPPGPPRDKPGFEPTGLMPYPEKNANTFHWDGCTCLRVAARRRAHPARRYFFHQGRLRFVTITAGPSPCRQLGTGVASTPALRRPGLSQGAAAGADSRGPNGCKSKGGCHVSFHVNPTDGVHRCRRQPDREHPFPGLHRASAGSDRAAEAAARGTAVRDAGRR